MPEMNGIEEALKKQLQEISIKNIGIVEEWLIRYPIEESNHNVVNMILWLKEYQLFYHQDKKTMLIFGIFEGRLFMMMPLCESAEFENSILKGKEWFKEFGQKETFCFFTKEKVDRLLKMNHHFQIELLIRNSDYIYSVPSLMTMSGKKLQKKRNHMNFFYQEYEGRYRYESLNENNIKECIEFLEKWTGQDEDGFLEIEQEGARQVLEYFGQLNYRGGCIRIDGKLEGFALGSVLSSRMVQENIEKANREIRGLHPVLIKEFLTHEFPEAELLNREDDMNHENLKAAKKSYMPIAMIDKYRVGGN